MDRAHVRFLQAGLAQLRAQDQTLGGGAVLPEALRQFTQARAMLDESDYTEAVGRELLIVAAELGLQSAWFAYVANDQQLARRLNQDERCWRRAQVTVSSAPTCTPTCSSRARTWLAPRAAQVCPGGVAVR
ncbi:MAG: hypothetical protein ACRDTE_16660 [Pseudonocardiaceae bacterium]